MITTHVLDVSKGRPAVGVPVMLEYFADAQIWHELGRDVTDAEGRAKNLVAGDPGIQSGTYRLTFDTAAYFADQNIDSFFPQVQVTFAIKDAKQHYHVPLLLSPFGFTTYRGS